MTLVEVVVRYLTEGRYDTAITYFYNHWQHELTMTSPENGKPGNDVSVLHTGFCGRAIDALHELIECNEASASIDGAHYSKYIPIIQIPEIGKSRLAAEVNRKAFSMAFTKNARGYPSGDYEILVPIGMR